MEMEDKRLSLDMILTDLESLKGQDSILDSMVTSYLAGEFSEILLDEYSQELFDTFTKCLVAQTYQERRFMKFWKEENIAWSHVCRTFVIGLTAFNAFLQANVTGPAFSSLSLLFRSQIDVHTVASLRARCFESLEKDGMSVYQHIPHVELYCFARAIFLEYFPVINGSDIIEPRWMRIRINVYHQRLLSSSTSNARLSDVAEDLQKAVDADLVQLEKDVLGLASPFTTEAKVQFLLEKAQIYIMQGLDLKARENIEVAKDVSGFEYVLSGALGKRTRFQQNDISQLVVIAKSAERGICTEHVLSKALNTNEGNVSGDLRGPTVLDLNDDTLLEKISFAQAKVVAQSSLPDALRDIQPDDQPQLTPLDQIVLLSEATLKDTLSPLDKLNSEEILPFAVRVLLDKPTNWQIYTQALLVRSRIEAHRSRTQERSVLQLQAIVDQIVADTENVSLKTTDGNPQISITPATSFLPRSKATESASVNERLRYVAQLNSPTRWEIETELAYAWSSVGSFLSALEIFKRLQLWPEVALCYHSVDQLDKAKQIVRRQLYFSEKGSAMDQYSIDADEVAAEDWNGEIRNPPPAHAPRLWCILGDLEQEPACWELAWEISHNRYARAQRSLGEYHSRQGNFTAAREAYVKAATVNRQNNETWSRLGDIDLRVGNWDGAIVAFQQSIMIDDHDAKTYSNLGSALLSKFSEAMELQKLQTASQQGNFKDVEDNEEEILPSFHEPITLLPKDILRQALTAYKKGASIAHDNWQIWDNVITIAGRITPPSYPEILMGMRAIIRIRSPTMGENAIDIDILRALIAEILTRERTQNASTADTSGIYVPPRGSLARAVSEMVDQEIVPLITKRAALWLLVEKLSLYRRDYKTALSAAEKAWRICSSGETWLEDKGLWKTVVETTDGLVSAYENYGPQVVGGKEVEKGWKGKARSAVRSILGKARGTWDDSDECEILKTRLEELNG